MLRNKSNSRVVVLALGGKIARNEFVTLVTPAVPSRHVFSAALHSACDALGGTPQTWERKTVASHRSRGAKAEFSTAMAKSHEPWEAWPLQNRGSLSSLCRFS